MVKNSPANAGDIGDEGSICESGRSPRVESGKPAPVFLPGKLNRQRSLVVYSPWDCRDSGMTARGTHPLTLRGKYKIFLIEKDDWPIYLCLLC